MFFFEKKIFHCQTYKFLLYVIIDPLSIGITFEFLIKEFEKDRKQKLNPKKCGIIELGVQRRNRKIPEEVENIPNCTDIGYKYLGVHLTKN